MNPNAWAVDLVDSIEIDMLAEYGADDAERIGFAVRYTLEAVCEMLTAIIGVPILDGPLT